MSTVPKKCKIARFGGLGDQIVRFLGRMKFAEMLSLIEKGKADGILSWNPDRLARNSVDGGKIIHMIDRGLIRGC